ncbi:MAG: 4Fe-4S dicluster domain-containing protein [Betaproteobacteria bacterium]|nr:MAG: 4Fe-4S dicluster domain-containing protein [Betaproteobacteria bacterium]
MARKGETVWVPPPERALPMPGTSANAYNGLGEAKRRQPRQIFWQIAWLRQPDGHPYAPVLKAVVDRFTGVPAYRDVYANADRGPRKLPDPGPRVEDSAENWTRRLRAFAVNEPGARGADYPGAGSEAELVGVARVDPAWTYAGQTADHPYLIVLGIAMDHARLSRVPSSAEDPEGQLEVCDQYNRGARAANWLALWIRRQGYRSRAHCGPWVGSLNLVPAALACGFGELGKHGSIINRQFGSSFRLAAVETDMPLVPDAGDYFGADDFCTRCQVCADACPPEAIFRHKQLVRGDTKWFVDFDKCIPYFNETYGCGICIAVCPWSTPGRAPTLAERWTRRARDKASPS